MTDEEPGAEPVEAALTWLRRRWRGIVVALFAVSMLLTRLRSYDEYHTDGGVYFIGTDPYYHARHVLYTVQNFPSTLGYDALTQYPIGTDSGQFGTLFDQLAAGLAWLVGLVVDGGMPTEETVLAVFSAYPAILGGLVVIPVYLLARDLFSPNAALFSALVVAVLPGEFLVRSLAGYVDHHILEAVLSTTAVWATYRALMAWEGAELDMATLAQRPMAPLDREHRGAVFTSLLAALAFWAYLAAWPPGVLFVGIVGAWIVIDIVLEHVRERDPAPVVLTGVGVFTPLAVLMLPYALSSRASGFSALNFTWMQPTSALLVALAAAGLAALIVLWEERDLPRAAYPAAALGSGVAALLVLWLVVPSLVEQTLSGTSWVTGIGVERTRLTIAEAQPASLGEMYSEFGFLFYTAALGFVFVLSGAVRGTKRGDTLLLVWSVLATTAAFTQARFLYYLAIAIALLNGELALKVHQGLQHLAQHPTDGSKKADQGPSMGASLFAAGLLLLAVVPLHATGFSDDCRGELNAWSLADCFGPNEERLWNRQLTWMEESTPAIPLTLDAQYDAPPKGERFEYPDGTYGVLSWWDYGHQIEFEARRPPVANPFQQQAPLASEIFTAPTETEALDLLDGYLGEGNDARYLMIDDAMVSTKFGAITVWADREQPDRGIRDTYQQGEDRQIQTPEGQQVGLPVVSEEVRDWFLQRVYWSDGSGMEHFRLVKESGQYAWIGNRGVITDDGRFQLLRYNTILNRAGAQPTINQFGSLNYESGERAIVAGGGGQGRQPIVYDVRVASALKTYERVEGAVLTGTAQPDAEVTGRVSMVVDGSERTFTYRSSTTAGTDGRFSLRVPYSTTDPVGPEDGGTELAVTAQGPYRVSFGNETVRVDVPDRAVLDGLDVPVLP